MPFIIRTKAYLHVLTQVWVIIWVATVPLFHTHLPDLSDVAVHQGLAHTVFSPDLSGEFVCHGSGSQLSTKSQNSPELGFLLSTEEDSKKWIYQAPSVLSICSGQFHSPLLTQSAVYSRSTHRKRLLASHRPPRAPPFIVAS